MQIIPLTNTYFEARPKPDSMSKFARSARRAAQESGGFDVERHNPKLPRKGHAGKNFDRRA
jgi:exosome complex RNA-binding protein Rrp42 (RNase PH superfamily)